MGKKRDVMDVHRRTRKGKLKQRWMAATRMTGSERTVRQGGARPGCLEATAQQTQSQIKLEKMGKEEEDITI